MGLFRYHRKDLDVFKQRTSIVTRKLCYLCVYVKIRPEKFLLTILFVFLSMDEK